MALGTFSLRAQEAAAAEAPAAEQLAHRLLLAREEAQGLLQNIQTLREAVTFHQDRLSMTRQRLLFARVEVDVRTRNAGKALEDSDGGDAGKKAMQALRQVEQRALELHVVAGTAQRQVELAQKNLAASETALKAARERALALENELRAAGAEALLKRLPVRLPEGRRHVDVCPFCQAQANLTPPAGVEP